MSGRALRQLSVGVFVLAAAVLCPPFTGAGSRVAAEARQDQPAAVTVPIRVVNGHLIVLTDLVGLRYTNEASFEISLEYPDALTLHPDQYRWLGLDPNDLGLADPPLIHLLIAGGIKLSIPARDIAVETSGERVAFQNSMTKLHSAELGERKLKGTIGVGLLKKYLVTLDVPGGQMTLAPPRDADPAAAPAGPVDLTAPFDYVNNRIQIALSFGESQRSLLALGGTSYDTFIDARVARAAGRPAGDLSPVWLLDAGADGRRLDLSQYLAFRPKPFGLSATPGADSPLVITGVNFLEYFRVELDWVNQRLALTQRKAPAYPRDDLAFFQAESQGTTEALEAYLAAHPGTRLSGDAADQLVRKRLEQDGATDADVMKALGWAIRATPADRRIETCLQYVDTFDALPNRTALAIAAGQEGLKYSRDAFDGRVVYTLHHRLGQLEMKRQQWDEAWKHLLSAAFMAPDDPNITLDLARVYDKRGEVRRAYARYKRLASTPGAPPEIAAEIKSAMERLRKQLPKDDPLLRDEQPTGRGRGGGGGSSR
jgi:hypothetical protein